MSAGQPRLATWLLTRCAPEYEREAFLGDLIEQYEQRGRWWYWRQALHALRTHAIAGLRSARAHEVCAAECVGDVAMALALVVFALNQLPFLAELLLSWTAHRVRSDALIVTVSALIVAALLATVAGTRVLRLRVASGS